MHYKQLTQEQRYQIYAFMKAGFNQKQTAAELHVHPSTVSRELWRNRGLRGYRPKQAQVIAHTRQQTKARPRLTPILWQAVETRLREQWSPEQISGFLKLHNQPSVSPERIYQYIYADKQAGGSLFENLRCQKKRRKRYGKNSRRGQIPNRRSIETRPVIVDQKQRLGDWEADTIIGKHHQQAIVSLVERKTKYCLLAKILRKTAELVSSATIARLL